MQVMEILLYSTPATVYAYYNDQYKAGDRVVVNVSNSLELGLIKAIKDNSENFEFVELIRRATKEDILAKCENCKAARLLLPEIKKEAENLNLDMKIGAIGYNLDKTKIIVNYTAEDRVDFRELIKILGAKYKARIEMRQIGNRDETKAVGALGICGREVCCKSFLSDFDKVSIKMAKNQNIALNPSRINGACGRLLCCLKYEDEFYADMQKKMPKIGSTVTTPDGKGNVSNTDFLHETVSVIFTKDDTAEIKTYDLKDIKF